MGVDSKGNKDEGAGDQGVMFGYACSETEVLMPAPIYYSHKILKLMAADRKNGKADKLEPDSKSQVTMMYENGIPTKVTSVVISTQHSPEVNQSQVKEIVRPYLEKSIPKELLSGLKEEEFYVNPTGQFIIGGPDGDSGLTGRKILHKVQVILFLVQILRLTSLQGQVYHLDIPHHTYPIRQHCLILTLMVRVKTVHDHYYMTLNLPFLIMMCFIEVFQGNSECNWGVWDGGNNI